MRARGLPVAPKVGSSVGYSCPIDTVPTYSLRIGEPKGESIVSTGKYRFIILNPILTMFDSINFDKKLVQVTESDH